jgi:hypothetical protein
VAAGLTSVIGTDVAHRIVFSLGVEPGCAPDDTAIR